MEKEVERREIELNSWRERYQTVKKNYDEQLCIPPCASKPRFYTD